jgi:hypothetical protein
MATTVARQIKHDFPGCHLTWAIGYKCKQVIENNPFVDEIWAVEYAANEHPYEDVWYKTKAEAQRRIRLGQFDRMFYTQLYPDNLNHFDGTTRTSIFRSYPGSICVPVQPVLRLLDQEVEHVKQFVDEYRLREYRNVVLFECAPGSNQSFLTPEVAIRVAKRVVNSHKGTAFVLSSHLAVRSDSPTIVDGSVLSFRENAELSKYCTLLLGCSSGITWLLTSDWAKKLPTIQFLGQSKRWYSFASVKYDHRFWGLDTAHILESNLAREEDVAELVCRYLAQGGFEGLPSAEFVPSTAQIIDLADAGGRRVRIAQVLHNFIRRNDGVGVDRPAFYGDLVMHRLKAKVKSAVRRGLAATTRVLSQLERFVRQREQR